MIIFLLKEYIADTPRRTPRSIISVLPKSAVFPENCFRCRKYAGNRGLMHQILPNYLILLIMR